VGPPQHPVQEEQWLEQVQVPPSRRWSGEEKGRKEGVEEQMESQPARTLKCG